MKHQPPSSPAIQTTDPERDEDQPTEEERLVRAFLGGDQDAFEQLVARYEGRIRRMAFSFVRDHGLAEDIAQDAFLQAYRRARTLKKPSAFRSWLFSIALNRARDELRRLARFTEVDDLEIPLRAFREPASTELLLESRQAGIWLAKLIADLPHKHRVPLLLKEAQGMTYADIAELLEIPMGTVQIRIHRARLELRERLVEAGVVDRNRGPAKQRRRRDQP